MNAIVGNLNSQRWSGQPPFWNGVILSGSHPCLFAQATTLPSIRDSRTMLTEVYHSPTRHRQV